MLSGEKKTINYQLSILLFVMVMNNWFHCRRDDEFPIYYYTGRDHWNRLNGEEKDVMSDGGSEGDTDGECEMDDDMTDIFFRVFN